jgi:uncharacterized membrane protein
MIYFLLKFIHIISSTILFGTGIGSAFYMFVANRKKEISGIYFATRNVVIADFIFTTPAIIIQIISGIFLVINVGYNFSDLWIKWGLILYFFTGACWLPVVWIQIQMRNMAKIALENKTVLPNRYWILDKYWIALGCLAFLAMMIIFYLMIVKPE